MLAPVKTQLAAHSVGRVVRRFRRLARRAVGSKPGGQQSTECDLDRDGCLHGMGYVYFQ